MSGLFRRVAGAVLVLVVIAGGWLAHLGAQKRQSSAAVEPFQIGVAVVVPGNDQEAVGTSTFTVPAGKLLNLKFLTVIHGFTARIEIGTTVAGVTVTHYRLTGPSEFDRPLYLWADDGAPVTVRILQNTANMSATTWNLSFSGELF